MLVNTSSSCSNTPTPGSSSSTSNTLEPSPNSTQPSESESSIAGSLGPPMANVANTAAMNNSRPPSRAPSILDSPTLARVERARLRLEQQQQQQQQHRNDREDSLERSILDPAKRDALLPWQQVWSHMKRLSHASKVNSTNTLTALKTDIGIGNTNVTANTAIGKSIIFPDKTASLRDAMYAKQIYFRPDMQSLLAGRIPVASMTGPIKRGLLWQQRDRLFSRWKERYFVLTRDYLHCFKRASGSANERASDMGQFIFKVKLVDVEKVEWLNRRSYSVIGLLLGREGRVLLRCNEGLEDWFELLEECTVTSQERRRALKFAQGPRSRASLAAPVSHASLQSNHFGLGGTYSSALDDWLMTNGSGAGIGGGGGGGRHKISSGSVTGFGGTNPFLLSDSVPDLSVLNNENHNHHISGLSTNHSTPQKIPYSSSINCSSNVGHASNGNISRYSNGYASQNNSFSNCTGLYGSPRRIFINSSFGSNNIVDEETEEGEVLLRRPRAYHNNGNGNGNGNSENGNEIDRDWLYRKPRAPTDMRHSVQPMLPTNTSSSGSENANSHGNSNSNANLNSVNSAVITTDLDYSAHDSGLDTPPSIHRPSSYREFSHVSARDSTETTVSSSRGTLLNSPGGSFRAKHLTQISNLNQMNALNGSRYSVQERILKLRNEEDRCSSIKSSTNRLNQNEFYDPNQNRYYKQNGGGGSGGQHHHHHHHPQQQSPAMTPNHTPVHKPHPLAHNGNNNGSLNGNGNGNMPNGTAIFRERYQHPALAAIINEAQGIQKFRDRSYSDCQQKPMRRASNNNNPSPLATRRNNVPIFGTPTRV